MGSALHVVDREPVNKAVAQLLRDVTQRPIGEAKAPTQVGNDQQVADVPYAILYPLLGGRFWGPLFSFAEDSAELVYQTTCVGIRQDQAQWMADRCRRAILGRTDSGDYASPLVVADTAVMMRESGGPPGGPTQAGSIWSVVDTYSIWVTVA